MAPLSGLPRCVPLAAALLAGAPWSPQAERCVDDSLRILDADKPMPPLEGEELFLVWNQSPRLAAAGGVGEVLPGVADLLGEGAARPGWEKKAWTDLLENRGRLGVAEHERRVREVVRRFGAGDADPLRLLGGGFLAGRLAAPDAFSGTRADKTAWMVVDFFRRHPESFAAPVRPRRGWSIRETPRERAELVLERRRELSAEIPDNSRSTFARGLVNAMNRYPDLVVSQGPRFAGDVVGFALEEYGHGRMKDGADTALSTLVNRTGHNHDPERALELFDKALAREADRTAEAVARLIPARTMDGLLETAIREGRSLGAVAALLRHDEGVGRLDLAPERVRELLDAAVNSEWFLDRFVTSSRSYDLDPHYSAEELHAQNQVLTELFLRAEDISMSPKGWKDFWLNTKLRRNARFALVGDFKDSGYEFIIDMRIDFWLMTISSHFLKYMVVSAHPRLVERVAKTALENRLEPLQSTSLSPKEAYEIFNKLVRMERNGEATRTLLEQTGHSLVLKTIGRRRRSRPSPLTRAGATPEQAADLLEPAMRKKMNPRLVMTLLEHAGDTVSPERAAEVERWIRSNI